jgi:hypothetical protein
VRRHYLTHTLPEFHPGIRKTFLRAEGCDFNNLLLVFLHGRKIDGGIANIDPDAFEFFQIRIKFAAGKQRFSGNAAAVRAGASPAVFFDDQDSFFLCCRQFRRRQPPRTAANDNQIILIGHVCTPLFNGH